MSSQDPAPVGSITLPRSFHRARWRVASAVFLVLVAAVVLLTLLVLRQQAEIASSCDFYRPLAGLVPATPPQTGRPSRLGVQIIAGSRKAYDGEGCGRPLGPPPPALARWAHYYGISLP